MKERMSTQGRLMSYFAVWIYLDNLGLLCGERMNLMTIYSFSVNLLREFRPTCCQNAMTNGPTVGGK